MAGLRQNFAGRAVVIGLAAGAVLGAAPSVAAGAQAYRGPIVGDGEGKVFFQVDRRPNGGKQVIDFDFTGLPVSCDNGTESVAGSILPEPMKVNQRNEFEGDQRGDVTVFVTGKLSAGGKANGTVRLTLTEPEGDVRCKSGLREWRASRVPLD